MGCREVKLDFREERQPPFPLSPVPGIPVPAPQSESDPREVSLPDSSGCRGFQSFPFKMQPESPLCIGSKTLSFSRCNFVLNTLFWLRT